ncbi:hypothetical protein PI124_g13909 [Phytophthora idaei]|nr:hypothetical protein PI125_g17177 [Phytophthora idaei]KAG3147088.1 hypothetical protein PI126_g13011 [Phytophthora idaei]KAG3241217.1 hypothetical protein PI124_g13909 [Phytophthora idaei]
MNLEGIIRDAKETRKWLHYWINTGESAETVATKLGSGNSAVLANYRQMLREAEEGKKYAKFGTGYQTKKTTMEWLGKWALEEKPLEHVAKQLKVWGKTDDALMFHRNYNAIQAYPGILEKVQQIRADHLAKLKKMIKE